MVAHVRICSVQAKVVRVAGKWRFSADAEEPTLMHVCVYSELLLLAKENIKLKCVFCNNYTYRVRNSERDWQ